MLSEAQLIERRFQVLNGELTTAAQALRWLLASRLRFGDIEQVEILDLLRSAETLLDAPPHTCENCDGEGYTGREPGRCGCCGRECVYCSGSEKCQKCRGNGERVYSRDEVYKMTALAIKMLTKDRREAAA